MERTIQEDEESIGEEKWSRRKSLARGKAGRQGGRMPGMRGCRNECTGQKEGVYRKSSVGQDGRTGR
jgi:hypothetical protein